MSVNAFHSSSAWQLLWIATCLSAFRDVKVLLLDCSKYASGRIRWNTGRAPGPHCCSGLFLLDGLLSASPVYSAVNSCQALLVLHAQCCMCCFLLHIYLRLSRWPSSYSGSQCSGIAYWHNMQAFMGEVYASFFFIFILMGMVIDKRCVTCLYAPST